MWIEDSYITEPEVAKVTAWIKLNDVRFLEKCSR